MSDTYDRDTDTFTISAERYGELIAAKGRLAAHDSDGCTDHE